MVVILVTIPPSHQLVSLTRVAIKSLKHERACRCVAKAAGRIHAFLRWAETEQVGWLMIEREMSPLLQLVEGREALLRKKEWALEWPGSRPCEFLAPPFLLLPPKSLDFLSTLSFIWPCRF